MKSTNEDEITAVSIPSPANAVRGLDQVRSDRDAARARLERGPDLTLEEVRALQRQLEELDLAEQALARLAPKGVLAGCRPFGVERLTRSIPPPKVLFENGDPNVPEGEREVLRCGVVAMVVAPPGTGKSQVAIQSGLSVATGMPWLNRFKVVDPGPVLLLLGEEKADEVDRRVQRTAALLGLLPEKVTALCIRPRAKKSGPEVPADGVDLIATNLWAEGLAGKHLALQGSDAGNPREEPFADDLRAFLRTNAPPEGWRLVVLDPLSRFAGPLVERDNYAATAFIETLETLTEAPGNPSVVVVHHTNKDALSGDATHQGAARGSSALVGGARWVANLESKGRDLVVLRLVKTNYGPGLGAVVLSRGQYGFLYWMRDGEDAPKQSSGNGSTPAGNAASGTATKKSKKNSQLEWP